MGEIHLAGFARQQDGNGDPLLIDNHGAPVAQAVWDLYVAALGMVGPMATLIERDHDLPPFHVLMVEAGMADGLPDAAHRAKACDARLPNLETSA